MMEWRRLVKSNARFGAACVGATRPPVLYASGWLGFHNLGDEALYAAAREIFGDRPFLTYDASVLDALPRMLPRPRTALLAGGTLINGAPRWLESFEACQDVCQQALVFGSGVQNPGGAGQGLTWEDHRARWLPVLRRCAYVGVRGPRSAELLAEVGFTGAEVIGDPVLVFADPALAERAGSPRGILGLNIGQSHGKMFGDEAAVSREMAGVARSARERGWRVIWFVVWPKDLPITRATAEASGTAGDIREIYEVHGRYLSEVGGCDLFMGLKLHAVVLAHCAMVPSVMVEYRAKCRDYMESVGREDLTIRADRLRAPAAMELLVSLMERRQEAAGELATAIGPMVTRLRQRAAEILPG